MAAAALRVKELFSGGGTQFTDSQIVPVGNSLLISLVRNMPLESQVNWNH